MKVATSVRYSTRDMRCLEADLRVLGDFGWDWRGQGIDCAYDEDEEAWDARYRVMTEVSREFALHFGELDVIRTGRNEFRVIDVTSTAGRPIESHHCRQLAQAMLVEAIRNAAADTAALRT